MRAVVQRVSRGQVNVDNKLVASIQRGLVVLLGVSPTDTGQDAQALAEKVANLRIFEDSAGKMNLSCLDVNGEILAVSQFTLYADTRRGRRPSFTGAAKPDLAEPLCARFVESLYADGPERENRHFRGSTCWWTLEMSVRSRFLLEQPIRNTLPGIFNLFAFWRFFHRLVFQSIRARVCTCARDFDLIFHAHLPRAGRRVLAAERRGDQIPQMRPVARISSLPQEILPFTAPATITLSACKVRQFTFRFPQSQPAPAPRFPHPSAFNANAALAAQIPSPGDARTNNGSDPFSGGFGNESWCGFLFS
jgi:D-tyrosyl-tRNA(Tyr) deacylase